MINKNKNKIYIINKFLNIKINTNFIKNRLVKKKLQNIIELINAALKKKFIFIKNLQSFTKFLIFAFKKMILGKIFFLFFVVKLMIV